MSHFSPPRAQASASVSPASRKSLKNTAGPLRSGAPSARARPSPSVYLASAADRHFGTVGVVAVPRVDRADACVLFSLASLAAHPDRMGCGQRPSCRARLTEPPSVAMIHASERVIRIEYAD
ncbi:hypothetical protein COMA2_270019 [Candidatus Nitrospira nitrificans]|uniref:Uncharacterized protein n=1 Tax=Candidatus Nitrospira nitrificans TaxID=1742973 RepID=A0A0S4LJB4_9BACT|nr:hypothetical protein COMA2_270019 [Candidatus Nitrospira nitrificans]